MCDRVRRHRGGVGAGGGGRRGGGGGEGKVQAAVGGRAGGAEAPQAQRFFSAEGPEQGQQQQHQCQQSQQSQETGTDKTKRFVSFSNSLGPLLNTLRLGHVLSPELLTKVAIIPN